MKSARRLPGAAIAALLLSAQTGCGGVDDSDPTAAPAVVDDPIAVVEASVTTAGGSTSLLFAPIGDGRSDIVAVSPERLQIDILFAEDGAWSVFGSAFTGELPPAQAVAGRVNGRGVVAVRLADQKVMLLASTGEPHRLGFPVRIYQREGGSALFDVALGDLDGDGGSDLLVAETHRIVMVAGLSDAVDAHPEHPPNLAKQVLDNDFAASAVSAIDIDADGDIDVLALARQGATVRLYRNAGDATFEATDIVLRAPGRSIVPGDPCGWGALVVQADGAVVTIDGKGAVDIAPMALPPAVRVAGSRDSLAIAARGAHQVSLAGACGESAAEVPGAPRAADLALDPSGGESARLAILAEDGRTITVMRVDPEP